MARAKKAVGRPGPYGSLIVPPDFKAGGPARGVRQPVKSRKQLDALRTNGYRRNAEGLGKKYALAVNRGDGKRAEETLEAILDANEGKFAALSRVQAGKLARLSVIQDAALSEVEAEGVTVREVIADSEGRVITERRREHPALSAALRLGEVVGVSAREQLLTPSSRNVARRDDAAAGYFAQQSRVTAFLEKSNPIDSEAVDGDEIEDADFEEGE